MQQSRPRGSSLSIGLPIATAIAVFTADGVTDLVALAVPHGLTTAANREVRPPLTQQRGHMTMLALI
jgi:hypothetical protein